MSIPASAGIRNTEEPKMMRDSSVTAMPTIQAGRLFFSFHCCRNSTINSALRAKSSPVVSNVIMPPSTLPSPVRAAQYRYVRKVIPK